jgi:tRNA(His) 5'-end guanylyltransferase
LRRDGFNEQQATKGLLGLSLSEKNELLFQYGINFNALPNWQKRGVGLYWEDYDRVSINPKTNEEISVRRRRIRIDTDLPMKETYSQFVRSFLDPQAVARR